MIKPIVELIDLFEQREYCKVKVTYGGSGHILRSVQVNRIGDIFFPGNKSYIAKLREQDLIGDTEQVGHNQAALFVAKGNPYQIDADLTHLTSPHLRVVIGSSEFGSIGRETRAVLTHAGMYQEVVDNALYLTTDSKGLVQALKRKEADLVVNWKAVYFQHDNNLAMDLIPLPGDMAIKQPLIMGSLAFSAHPQLARKFLDLCASDTGAAVFKKYGFID